mmetsp:Transcript_25285/g.35665  ORF Transcript_25285/g.35665 Transcript_25285/m.35665 type:complete len:226 (+) Transcript_25285:115-792(+)
MISYPEFTREISKSSTLSACKSNKKVDNTSQWQETCSPLHCSLPTPDCTTSKLGFIDNETDLNPINMECLPTKNKSLGDAIDDLFRYCPLDPFVLPEKKQLRFGAVGIREHPVIVGDNPTVKVGLPLQLGWDHQEEYQVDIEIYEATKSRRKRPQKLDAFQRVRRLQQFQPLDQLVKAEKKREQTIISLLPKSKTSKLSRYCGGGQTLSRILQETPTFEISKQYL